MPDGHCYRTMVLLEPCPFFASQFGGVALIESESLVETRAANTSLLIFGQTRQMLIARQHHLTLDDFSHDEAQPARLAGRSQKMSLALASVIPRGLRFRVLARYA